MKAYSGNTQPLHSASHTRPGGEEIEIADVLALVIRRKAVIFAVMLLTVVLSVAVAGLRTSTYTYYTILEIGSDQNGENPIENPAVVSAKLNNGHIPLVLHRYRQKSPDGFPWSIKASLDNRIIRLETEGAAEAERTALDLLQAVAAEVMADHERATRVQRGSLEAQRDKLRGTIASLRHRARLLEANSVRTEETARLLAQQMKEAQKFIETNIAAQKSMLGKTSNEDTALTRLILNNGIQEARLYINKIDERLNIDLPAQRDELQKQIADTRREIANLEEEIRQIELRLSNMRETRTLIAPMQLSDSSGPGMKAIVAVSVLLGAVLGVLAALGVEFFKKQRLQSDGNLTLKSS